MTMHHFEMILTGETRSTWRKTYPSATLFTADPTWTGLGSNPRLRVERPATNHRTHGTARHAVMLYNEASPRTCSLNRSFPVRYIILLVTPQFPPKGGIFVGAHFKI
jgi:hypothetical protein